MGILRTLVLIGTLAVFCSACSTIQYLAQAGRGQLSIMHHARSIEDVILDHRTPTKTKAALKQIEPAKKFGEQWGLKRTHNYEEFVKLDRDAVVYVVSASDKLKFAPKTWNFPIVGSFTYLGWYDKKSALDHVERLRAEGWDADARGASAYSTLGWFRDPILSTMMSEGVEQDVDLIHTLFHESFHATHYVEHQSWFNEAAADFVADVLTDLYFKQDSLKATGLLEEWKKHKKESQASHLYLTQAYQKLSKVYESNDSDEVKAHAKAKLMSEIKEHLKLKKDPNNAWLIQFKTYRSSNEVFEKLYQSVDKNIQKLIVALSAIDEKAFQKEQQENFEEVILKQIVFH